jgi:hypothetical protein
MPNVQAARCLVAAQQVAKEVPKEQEDALIPNIHLAFGRVYTEILSFSYKNPTISKQEIDSNVKLLPMFENEFKDAPICNTVLFASNWEVISLAPKHGESKPKKFF